MNPWVGSITANRAKSILRMRGVYPSSVTKHNSVFTVRWSGDFDPSALAHYVKLLQRHIDYQHCIIDSGIFFSNRPDDSNLYVKFKIF